MWSRRLVKQGTLQAFSHVVARLEKVVRQGGTDHDNTFVG